MMKEPFFLHNKKSIFTFLRNRIKKHGLVPTDVTVGALPGGGTGAVEGTVRVHTGSAILTRNVQTLVYVYKYLQLILKKRAIPELLLKMSMQYCLNSLFFHFAIYLFFS